MMETQQDSNVRAVALANLEAMCKRVSGMCHTYTVIRASKNRVVVEYSNPDEYGRAHPIEAHYPCYPSVWQGDTTNPRVVLDAVRYVLHGADVDPYHAFCTVIGCPMLYRDVDTGEWAEKS